MNDPAFIIPIAATLVALLIAIAVALRGWQNWLDLKRAELEVRSGPDRGSPSPAARIELADLKERVRRLEAIANGVDS
jgi:hypothetical protein